MIGRPRVAPTVLAAAIRRLVEAENGFATVLTRGNPEAGAMLLVVEESGGDATVVERLLQPGGQYQWQESRGPVAHDDPGLVDFLEKRRRYDPDLWILELRVPSTERLIVQLRELD